MSVEVVRVVLQIDRTGISPTERLVLLILAWHADKTGGNAYPSVARMARQTSLTRRAVQKALRRLMEKHFIGTDGRGPGSAVRYTLDLTAADRERGTPSPRERRSPPPANVVRPPANVVRTPANLVRGGANMVRPICH